jgi:ABC-type Zn uptake system ZnuABC Zn-binding protein ZnuA
MSVPRRYARLLVAVVGLLAVACVPPLAAPWQDGRLRVVTTVAPLADLVRQIAGDRVRLVQLVPDGADSHTFEPHPSDARALQEADLIILNGLHLEMPTQRLADANRRPEAQVLLLGDSTIARDEWVFDFSFPESEGDPNPHLWLDPLYARRYVELIRDKLVELDQANAEYYRQNAAQLLERLARLDVAIGQAVQSVPENRRKLLTYHDSWAYFARRYGLRVIGAIQPSDFSEPSPREVAALVDQVRTENVPAIFGSEVFPSRVLEAIGRETGARYVDTLRDDALPGEPDAPNHTYLGMMLENMRTIFSALGGRVDVFDGIDPSPIPR